MKFSRMHGELLCPHNDGRKTRKDLEGDLDNLQQKKKKQHFKTETFAAIFRTCYHYSPFETRGVITTNCWLI